MLFSWFFAGIMCGVDRWTCHLRMCCCWDLVDFGKSTLGNDFCNERMCRTTSSRCKLRNFVRHFSTSFLRLWWDLLSYTGGSPRSVMFSVPWIVHISEISGGCQLMMDNRYPEVVGTINLQLLRFRILSLSLNISICIALHTYNVLSYSIWCFLLAIMVMLYFDERASNVTTIVRILEPILAQWISPRRCVREVLGALVLRLWLMIDLCIVASRFSGLFLPFWCMLRFSRCTRLQALLALVSEPCGWDLYSWDAQMIFRNCNQSTNGTPCRWVYGPILCLSPLRKAILS